MMTRIALLMAALLISRSASAGQLGQGAGSSYPTVLDTKTTFTDKATCDPTITTRVCSTAPNDFQDAIVKVETELGLLPKGSFANVAARLNAAVYIGTTGVTLTPAAGGLVYSTATTLDVQAAGTSGWFARSGGTAAPTFFDLFGSANTWTGIQTHANHLLFSADNTYDIGASAATRPRDLYLGRDLRLDNSITLGAGGIPASGVLKFAMVTGTIDGGTLNSNLSIGGVNAFIWNASAFRPATNGGAALGFPSIGFSKLYLDFTNTVTVGPVTINKAAGRVNIAAAGTSVVVTDSLVTAASHVVAWMSSADATGRVTSVVPAAGSFTINTVATTAQASFDFLVINAD